MIQQIRKTVKKSKVVRQLKSSKRSRNLSKKVMRGGDAGRFVLPPAYFGDTPSGYFPEGSPELKVSPHSVSQGVMWSNGQYAGPNLYPSMTGGGCGCNGGRKYKNKNKNKSKKSKSKLQKSKSLKSKSKSRRH